VSDGTNEIFSFNSSTTAKYLNIFNLLGTIAFSTYVVTEETWTQVPIASLPPGCYFARLGDQVAKFVVPPR